MTVGESLRMIAPRTGHPETTIAEEQLEYCPITVNIFTHADGPKTILARFQPTTAQRTAIAAGEDIYVGQLNFGGGMAPLTVTCGRPAWVPVVAGDVP